jgi:hypothetical protein
VTSVLDWGTRDKVLDRTSDPAALSSLIRRFRLGKVTSDASTVESSCSTARAESAIPVDAETALAFIARTPTATWRSAFLRTRSTYAHFKFVDCLLIALCETM